MSQRVLLFGLLFIWTSSGFSQDATLQRSTLNQAQTHTLAELQATDLEAKLSEIDQLAATVMDQWHVPGMAIAIVKDGQLVFSQGYGVRELGQVQPVDPDTVFAIASNSKAFVTAALSILVTEGKLQWDDRASKYLPELQLHDPTATQEITIRDLVSHRSGLGTFSGDLLWYGTNYSPAEILQRSRHIKPVSSFRNQYGYQNLMFIAAGQVVERVSGQTCADFVRTRLLTPLGMTRTTTSVRDFQDNVASPHNESGGTLRVLPHGNVDNCWGACGLNASAVDLSKWLRLQLGRGDFEGKQLLSRQQVWEMWQPNISVKISEEAFRFNPTRQYSAYGLGWFLSNYQGRRVVGHGGGLDGMISQTAMMPEENLGLVVLTNSESPVSTILRESIFDILLDVESRTDWNAAYKQRYERRQQTARETAEKWTASRIANTSPTLAWEQYCGTYRCPMYGDVTIALEDLGTQEESGPQNERSPQKERSLVLRLGPASDFVADLEHWHYNCFVIRWRPSVNYNFPRGSVNFTISPSGQTDQLVIDQPNDDFWFYEMDLHRVPD